MHAGTSLGVPSLANSVIITKTLLAPIARSIAPPTAGIASGSPVCQLARSPVAETWKAPSTQTSRWPPRIIANESAWWKYDAPGSSVTGILPALVRSGSISSPMAAGPMLSMPFSVCSTTPESGSRWSATSVGWPMPRLTYDAARDVLGDQGGDLVLAEHGSYRHHPVDVDARRHDGLGVELADLDDLGHLGDRRVAAVAITGPKLRAVLR